MATVRLSLVTASIVSWRMFGSQVMSVVWMAISTLWAF